MRYIISMLYYVFRSFTTKRMNGHIYYKRKVFSLNTFVRKITKISNDYWLTIKKFNITSNHVGIFIDRRWYKKAERQSTKKIKSSNLSGSRSWRFFCFEIWKTDFRSTSMRGGTYLSLARKSTYIYFKESVFYNLLSGNSLYLVSVIRIQISKRKLFFTFAVSFCYTVNSV